MAGGRRAAGYGRHQDAVATDPRPGPMMSPPTGSPELAADVVTFAEQLGARRSRLMRHDWGGVVVLVPPATQPSCWRRSRSC